MPVESCASAFTSAVSFVSLSESSSLSDERPFEVPAHQVPSAAFSSALIARPSPGPGAAEGAVGEAGDADERGVGPEQQVEAVLGEAADRGLAGQRGRPGAVEAPELAGAEPRPERVLGRRQQGAATGPPGPPFAAFHGPGAVGSSPGPVER